MTQFTRSVIPTQVAGHALNPHRSPWSVVIPEATTNLIVNPSFETNVANWAISEDGSSGFGISAATSYHGALSCSITRSGGTSCGVYTTPSFVAGNTYTWSLKIFRTSDIAMHLEFREHNITPTLIANTTKTINGAINAWSSEFMTVRVNPSTAIIQLVVYMDEDGTSYIDSVQFEAKAYPTTYCDGDQEGCYWTGTPHASQSKRPATERTGGRVWNFRDFGFDVIDTIGAGAPPVNVIDTPFALIGGGYYQRSTHPIRQFSIAGAFTARSGIEQARNRKALWDAVKPDLVAPQQPVRLLYSPRECDDVNTEAIVIDAVYAGGLEGALANSEIDRVALGFRVHEPGFIGLSIQDTSQSLNYELVLSTADYFFVRDRTTGAFLDVGLNGYAYAVVKAPQGGVYVGGSFTDVATRIAHYNHATNTWTALGTGANDDVNALLVGPDGMLYAGGRFISIGGVAVTGIARWNGSAWSALGGGVGVAGGTATVSTIAFDYFGTLWIGGNFTSVNGVAANNIAEWNGSVWNASGTGANGYVRTIMPGGGTSPYIYIGGAFTSVNGVAANGVAQLFVVDGTWSDVAGGIVTPGEVNKLIKDASGRMFAIGEFTGMTNAPDAANVAVFQNGWSALGGGFNDVGISGAILPDGNVMATGEFFDDGQPVRPVDFGAVLMGNTWISPDWQPDVGRMRAMVFYEDYEYYGGDNFTNVRAGESTAVVNVSNVPEVPTFTITGPGTLVCIKNITTGDALYFNLTLVAGEVAVLKLGSQPKFYSNVWPDLSHTILPPSNPATFKLLSGTNYIYTYILGASGNTLASVSYKRRYESLDQIW